MQFRDRNPTSLDAHQAACESMPGGNTRTVIWHEPFPLRIASASGAIMTDADGHDYVDFLGEYTAGLFGHSHPDIQAATSQAMQGGISLGAHNQYEYRFAQLLCQRFPVLQRLRFTNSGTEANMMAISASRVFTGRDKVMVFRGGYHGGVFYFGLKESPLNAPFPWIIAEYNDMAATREMMAEHGQSIACVIVEPMQGSAGCIPAQPEFLQALRELCTQYGSLLIFDEVMTSRLGAGGASEWYGVKPDVITLGKYLGGGHSFGAFGGSVDFMARFDPSRPDALMHAGTFQNNVLTMATGIQVLEKIFTTERADAHMQLGELFRDRLNRLFDRDAIPVRLTGLGSLMNLHPTTDNISSVHDLAGLNDDARAYLYFRLLEEGFYIARRGFIALSLVLEPAHLDGLEQGLMKVGRELKALMETPVVHH